jgi:tungstate transport system ATP-binding protein
MAKEIPAPVFEARNISKSFDGNQILEIDHIVFEKGKIYCLYGSNGSGKTTLFEVLMNIQKPDSGKILFKGKESFPHLDDFCELRKKATLIQQSPLLFDTTVEKNVDYGLRLRKFPKAERKERVDKCLSFVGLEGFHKHKARELSGGEAQRVAIARALSIDPEVIFLDEFSANIDSRYREKIEKIIRDINENFQTTIIFTTHYMDQAYRLSDNVIHLYQGKIVTSEVKNIFHGIFNKQDNEIFFSNEKIKVSVKDAKEGAGNILIPVTAITISKEPLVSSMRNCIKGKVSQITDNNNSIMLKVLAGELFEASITKKSFNEMELGPGTQVCLNFKSTAVEIL